MDLGNKDTDNFEKEIDTVDKDIDTVDKIEETTESVEETTEYEDETTENDEEKFIDRSYEIPDHEYAELPPDDTPRVKLLKRVGLVVCGIAFLGLVIFISNKIMDRLYPDSLKEVRMKEASAASKDKETESDLNIKIDDINGADAGKSLDEILGGDSIILDTKGDASILYDNDTSNNDSNSSNTQSSNENTGNGNNENIAEGSPSTEGTEGNTDQAEIDAIIKSRIESDAQPVQTSGGVEALHEYYESVGESLMSDPKYLEELKEHVH